ncbi:MAG: rhodanese-like domain-containing protein [Deltaproteobacteria bacterium]|nr:rhodanese-like domain-containing protein [Deltaproteobacteria bacterium]
MTTWIVVAVIAAALWYYLFRFGKISSAEAHQRVDKGARLIDVRTPEEFAGGHIAGAVNIPLSDLQSDVDRVGPKDAEYVLYCASGARSAAAARMLKSAGREKVYDLGSIGRW